MRLGSGLHRARLRPQQVAIAPAFVFTSDWSNSTGNNTTACRDGTRWDAANNIATPSAGRVEVLALSGLGLDFPATMANCLAIRYERTPGNIAFCGVEIQDGWTLPSVGGVLCKRMYFRMAVARTVTDTHHPVQTKAGTCAYSTEWVMNQGSTFEFQVATLRDGVSPASEIHRWVVAGGLQRDVTYRIEERYERLTTTTWRLHVRIYNSANTLLYDDADLVCNQSGHSSHTLEDNIDIVTPTPECLENLMIVNQGQLGDLGDRGADAPDENRIFYGGCAISKVDWCGPYILGESP